MQNGSEGIVSKLHGMIMFIVGLALLVAVLFFPFSSGDRISLKTGALVRGAYVDLSDFTRQLINLWVHAPPLGFAGAMFAKLPAALLLVISFGVPMAMFLQRKDAHVAD